MANHRKAGLMKMKIFTDRTQCYAEDSLSALQGDVNEFLAARPGVELIDVKFTATSIGEGIVVLWLALFYEEFQPDPDKVYGGVTKPKIK
jgi:hypothetical protein